MFNKSKQNPKIWLLAILTISLTFLFAACGGSEPAATPASATPQPAKPPPTATPAPAQAAENPNVHLEAAATYYANGEYDQAISELEKALELEPDNADARTNLALSYFKNGDYEKAVAAWTEVIKFKPDEADPYYERGLSYFNLKKYNEALDDLSQAIDLDSTSADAYRVRGKTHAFMENYEQAIADFTRTIELDPASDEAYFNRAVSATKIGNSANDLAGIIADYGIVLQISQNPDLREQAQKTLETFLQNSDDPVLRQQATDALQGIVAAADTAAGAEPSLTGIDINRAPGHSIGFENSLEPGGTHRFLFLASPGDTIGAGVSSASNLRIGIQNAQTGELLGAVPANDNSLLVTIPQNALYHIVIGDTGGQGGDYTAAFEASPKVSFALDPHYFMIGRLPQGGLLYYTYTAPGGAILQGNVIPHPDTPVDLAVKILDLESQALLSEFNESGPGENEQFTFTVPNNDDGKLLTYIVSVEDVGQNKGAYILGITSDAPVGDAPASVTSPESVVQVVFDTAKSGDFAALKELCDPRGENDDDTKMICNLATDETNREEFAQYFATGKINGEAKISPDGVKAEVPFSFGPDGNNEETMELINRDGQWYLFSF